MSTEDYRLEWLRQRRLERYKGPKPETIRITRTMLELTQKQFGELCGVSRVQVSLWETGKSLPSRAAQLLILAQQRRLLFGDQL